MKTVIDELCPLLKAVIHQNIGDMWRGCVLI